MNSKSLAFGILLALASGSAHPDDIRKASFVLIQPGEFKFRGGENPAWRSGSDPLDVKITKAFEIMQHEVTQAHWVEKMKKNPSFFSRPEDCENHTKLHGVELCPDNPIESVSWKKVDDFIEILNDELNEECDGRPGDPAGCYRLPTDAEWEWAAVADTNSQGPAEALLKKGAESVEDYDSYAWTHVNADRPQPVATKLPTLNNLYDMYGNVAEWVLDGFPTWRWNPLNVPRPEGEDPYNSSWSSSQYVRGGSIGDSFRPGSFFRQRSRVPLSISGKSSKWLGFRLVRQVD